MHRWLVIAKSEHGRTLVRYWLIRESTLYRVRAQLYRECGVATVVVVELQTDLEKKAG